VKLKQKSKKLNRRTDEETKKQYYKKEIKNSRERE
jgi:hypothetical protein